MRKAKGISATTHVDSQGDQISVGALVKQSEDSNAAYYPYGLNHDPRIAPPGRVVKSRVVLREDGEAAVEFEAEIFEEGDVIEFDPSGRRMPAAILRADRSLVYDRTFGESEVKTISSLAYDLGLRPHKRTKKAADPLSILIFCAGAVAVGFLGKFGEDLYGFGKKQTRQLCALMTSRRGNTRVLLFQFELSRAGRPIQVEIFLTNPKKMETEDILNMKVSKIEEFLAPLFTNPQAVKVVAEYSNGCLIPKFFLRADGVPFDASGRLVAYRGDLPTGVSISFQEGKTELPR